MIINTLLKFSNLNINKASINFKSLFLKLFFLLIVTVFSTKTLYAQLPANVLVGYLHNWENLTMSQAHANYNVICLAFAYDPPTGTPGYNIDFTRPPGYATDAAMMADIDLMHSQGKVVLLSLGGATGPIMLNDATQQATFESSITTIFTRFGNKLDGLDLDLETSGSMGFGSTWTITSPDARQTRMVNAVKNIMATYQTTNGKKMILTAAPEVVYLMGGLSAWQVSNVNGGAFLPILDGLRNEIDLLHMQLYNAGGASGGIIAWNGTTYYDTGNIDFVIAMNESIVKGFTCVSGKGVWNPFPASKIAFGLPANADGATAGTGYLTPAQICDAARYFKGEIAKPAGVTYTMFAFRPQLRGLMTWSINQDKNYSTPTWNFAIGYPCAFPIVTLPPVADFTYTPSPGCTGQTVTFTDASTNTPTSWSWDFGAGATPATANTQGPHNVTYSTTGSKTVTLTAGNASGNDPETKSVTITTIPSNAGAITGTTSVCQGSSQNYSITAVAGATNYTWTVPAGSTINSGQGTTSINVTIGPSSGNVGVTPSNGCGNSTGSTLALTVSPLPPTPGVISGTSPVCSGSTGNVYSITAVGGATGYNWTVPAGSTITAGTNTTSITVTFGSTSGNITVAAVNGCGAGTVQTRAITVNTAPAAAGPISGNVYFCSNQNGVAYSIAAVSGATNYTWTVPGGATVASGQGTTAITVNFGTNSGNIQVTPSNSCGSGTASILAVSNTGASIPLVESFETSVPPPSWSITNPDAGITWASANVAVTGTKSATMNFYNYASPLGTRDYLNVIPVDLSSVTSSVMTFKHAYRFYNPGGTMNDRHDSLAVEISTNCGSSWTQVWKNGGVAMNTSAGVTAEFTTPTAGEWVLNTINLSALGYDGTPTLYIRFVGINRNGNNLFLEDINITGSISSAPVANFNASITTACTGQTITFTDASSNTPTSWSWDFGAGASPATANTQGPHNVTYSTAGTKTVSLTATNAFGNNTNTKTNYITVNTIPAAAGAISGTSTICSGTTGNVYSITAVAGATGYNWTLPAGATITAGTNTNSITVTMGSTSGNITVTPTNSCGNGTSSNLAITVNITPATPGSISGTTPICSGSSNSYSISAVTGASSYTWTLPAGWTGSSTTTSINTTASTSSGNISVVANSATCGSSAANTLAVTVNTTPAAPGSISGINSVCPVSANTYTISPVAGATSYTWTLPAGWSGSSTTTTLNATSTSSGGTLSVTASNACGTSSASSMAITIGGGLSVSGATRCGTGVVNLSVLSGGGPFNWFTASTGGSSINTGSTYSPSISATTTYWVEENSLTNASAGINSSPPNSWQVYNLNTATRTFDPLLNTMNFTTSLANVTINSVDVYTGSGSQAYLSNFWITIEDAGSTVLFTSPKYTIVASFPTPNPKFQTVPISLLLPTAASYKMRIYSDPQADAWGQYADGQTFPQSDASNVVTLNSGFSGLVNVQFQYGNASACGRTPVVGTVNCAPSVTLVSPPPPGPTPHSVNSPLALSSTASDDGSIVSMSYVIRRVSDGVIVATVVGGAGPNYTANWTPTIVEDYSITAVATDDGGLTGSSATGSITVTPLPISLVSFSGSSTDEGNLLQWITASETNNSHFIVERSANGKDFEELGRIEGNGNSSGFKNYFYMDTKSMSGNNFYRLVQYDFDDKNSASNIILINNTVQICTIIPNPFENSGQLILENIQDARIEIMDVRGNIISTYTTNEAQSEIGSSLTPGVYQVRIISENYSSVLKIVKM